MFLYIQRRFKVRDTLIAQHSWTMATVTGPSYQELS